VDKVFNRLKVVGLTRIPVRVGCGFSRRDPGEVTFVKEICQSNPVQMLTGWINGLEKVLNSLLVGLVYDLC
jgi:hypothetical protein